MLTFHSAPRLDFSDVLLIPRHRPDFKAQSRSEIDLMVDGALPLIVANMDTIGTFEVANHLKDSRIQVALLKDYTVEEWQSAVAEYDLDPRLLIPTLGIRDLEEEIARVCQLVDLFPTIAMVCLDVPNGYLPVVGDAVRQIRQALPKRVKLCAGNIVDRHGLQHLAEAGADVIKVGIGSGGVCLTRRMTGVGYPQLSAIMELAPHAEKLGVQLISDGGITNPGDMMKAYAAGAHFVMSGSYFAGHEETGVHFHGMSSDRSRHHRGQNIADYRASEGRDVTLANKGSLAHTVRGIIGGLNSSCMYLSLYRLADIHQENIEMIRVNQQLNRINGVENEG